MNATCKGSFALGTACGDCDRCAEELSKICAQRAYVVREAREWLGTPYRFGGCVKQGGADCATLLLGVYVACSVLYADLDHGEVAPDWWAHTTEERYVYRALRHAHRTLEAVCHQSTKVLPGNAVLTRTRESRVFNHGAIVTEWPMIVHATLDGVREVNATTAPLWSYHEMTVLDPWVKQ